MISELIGVILANTDLTILSGKESITTHTIIGTPQGDELSPILITSLEVVLRSPAQTQSMMEQTNPCTMATSTSSTKTERKQESNLPTTPTTLN